MGIAVVIASIVFLVIVIGVPRALWKQRAEGAGGVVLWGFVTVAVLIFAIVVFVAEVSLIAGPHP